MTVPKTLTYKVDDVTFTIVATKGGKVVDITSSPYTKKLLQIDLTNPGKPKVYSPFKCIEIEGKGWMERMFNR